MPEASLQFHRGAAATVEPEHPQLDHALLNAANDILNAMGRYAEMQQVDLDGTNVHVAAQPGQAHPLLVITVAKHLAQDHREALEAQAFTLARRTHLAPEIRFVYEQVAD